MAIEKYTTPKSPAQRIVDRLKSSCPDGATHSKQMGEGPTRVHHSVFSHGQGPQGRRLSHDQRGDAFHQQSEGDE